MIQKKEEKMKKVLQQSERQPPLYEPLHILRTGINKTSVLLIISLALVFSVVGAREVRGDISIIGDKLTVTGFLRYELGMHTGGRNPNNRGQDNFDFTLARGFFQTEWTYKPTSTFKLFSKIRMMTDQTYHWDSELDRYNAFPVDVPDKDWMMLKASGDDYRFEIWELYSELRVGPLWMRLGKQQIVWGEMIAARLMDTINPLDLSWNFLFEPEEFENIRIPNWAGRVVYTVPQTISWLNELTIEGFFNPGDVLPNQYADQGAPFNIFGGFPPWFSPREKDRRGNTEYGARLGAMIGTVYFTLNYMHLYDDNFQLKFRDFITPPLPPLWDLTMEYPDIDIYGATFNYYIGGKMNTVVTFEGLWIPNQPYGDAKAQFPGIRDQGTAKYAIKFDRLTFVLPRPTSAMNISLQFSQTIREGDKNKLLGPNNSAIDTNNETVVFQIRQPLWHNNIEVSSLYVYDLDGAYQFKPSFKYVHGDHWYFDVFGVFLGGTEDRPRRIGSLDFADQVVFRITYQF
jgi:hypothetical protein